MAKYKIRKIKGLKEGFSKVLNQKYLSWDGKILTEKGVLLDRELVKAAVKKSNHNLVSLYQAELHKGILYDYEMLRNKQYFRSLKKPWFALERAKEHFKSLKQPGKFNPLTLLRLAMLLIGLVAVTMSADITTEYLAKTNPMHRALRLSWTMIIFAVVAFDLIVHFAKKKKVGSWALAVVFSFLWLITTGFSMFSTMEVQYSGFQELTEALIEENMEGRGAQALLESLEERITLAERDLAMREDSIKEYMGREVFSTWLVTEMQKEYTDKAGELSSLRKEYGEVKAANPTALTLTERKDTFYDQVEKVLNIAAHKVHFFVQVLPALFIDLIAPFSLAVATFLTGGMEYEGKALQGEKPLAREEDCKRPGDKKSNTESTGGGESI